MEPEIATYNITELWNIYRENADQDELRDVKNGYIINVDIRYYTKEWYTEYPKTKTVKIPGHGTYNLIDFLDDKEKREDTMRTALLEALHNPESTRPFNTN